MSSDDTSCRFFKAKASRADTGTYEVKMKNSEGEDCMPVKIVVLDKPGKCEGPLEVLDTTKSSVTLQWKPPRDDGGADITGYIIEKCAENSDTWEKCPGIFIQSKATVKHLEEGKAFKFRVRAENAYGEGEPLETKSHVVVKPPYGNHLALLFLAFLFLFKFTHSLFSQIRPDRQVSQ